MSSLCQKFSPVLQLQISTNADYVHKVSIGKRCTFVVNKLLDLHYSLLASGTLRALPQFAESLNFYESLFRQNLDFALISDKIRYPIVAAQSRSEIEYWVQELFKSMAQQFTTNLLNAYRDYLEWIWDDRAPVLEAALKCFELKFLPYEEALFDALVASLRYAFDKRIPVFPVAEGTIYGAFASEPPLTVINVCRTPEKFFNETILHEATHTAEDYNAARPDSALAILKRELVERGKGNKFAEVWHCLIFWNSGELIRRYLDPSHAHYGQHIGLYDSSGERASELFRSYWNAYLDGKMSMEAALENIAQRL